MDRDQVLQQRRICNESSGEAFLADVGIQQSLRFRWNGATIEDVLTDSPVEYFYPSTIGMALLYHGSFEAGEIAFSNEVLAQIRNPVILDVGANIGLHSVAWAVNNPTAKIFAFEPVPSNCEVLLRNADRAGVEDRIVLSKAALSDADGVATLYECVDSAYSTLHDRAAMPVSESYEVATMTVDAFAASRGVERVDFLKIDTEGLERAVLAGAEATIARDAPCLFVEIGTSEGREPANDTIAWIVAHGYRAYLISDGIVTEANNADDDAHNYFFLHESSTLTLPTTNPVVARAEAKYQNVLIRTSRRQLIRLRASLNEKDEEIRHLKAAADERLSLINRLDAQVAATGDGGRFEEEAVASEQLHASSWRAQVTQLRQQLETRDEMLEEMRGTVQGLHDEVALQHRAATERLSLIEDMERRMQLSGAQVAEVSQAGDAMRVVAEERADVIQRIQAGLEARDAEIVAARTHIDQLRVELSNKDAVLDRLESMVRENYERIVTLQGEVAREVTRAAELGALAQERLEVIQTLNRSHKAGSV